MSDFIAAASVFPALHTLLYLPDCLYRPWLGADFNPIPLRILHLHCYYNNMALHKPFSRDTLEIVTGLAIDITSNSERDDRSL